MKGLEYNEGNKQYIQDLMFIERVVSGERINYIAGMSYESKKREYSSEFKEILLSLIRKATKTTWRMKEQRKRKLEESRKQHEQRMVEEEEISKKSWGEVYHE